jgi:hypothetical protein
MALGARRSPFTVHRSPFTVHRSPFAVRRSPFGVWRLAFGVDPFGGAVRCTLFCGAGLGWL